MRNIREEIYDTRNYMRGFGFRPVTEADLEARKELFMVEVGDFYRSTRVSGWKPELYPSVTRIELDEEPTRVTGHRPGEEPTVYYHCVMPLWSHICFVGLTEFTRDAYVAGNPHGNDTRYFVKTRN